MLHFINHCVFVWWLQFAQQSVSFCGEFTQCSFELVLFWGHGDIVIILIRFDSLIKQ